MSTIPLCFSDLFLNATGFSPYPYQTEMAATPVLPSLVSIPTGMGKTAAVVLSWLWRRRFAEEEIRRQTPRRLVYCLPMRVLVEQTRDCAVNWLSNLGVLAGTVASDGTYQMSIDDNDGAKIPVHLLMGGELDRDWDRYPERDAILVGTQDMLLSRALNRGYATSRFRWPLQFGLLNNDCLWVMDEVQLMGNGLATTAQLQAFRRALTTLVPVRSMWMSATLRPDWLQTVDFDPDGDAEGTLGISDPDRAHPQVRRRLTATKPLQKADFETSKDGKAEAALVVGQHAAGTRTLVVVNTVKRSQDIYNALQKLKVDAKTVLLHSRFRQNDRDTALQALLAEPPPEGTIAVSTQVVEAGVDVSAKTLITDLAPWSSMIQRFGRCNRGGEIADAKVIWIAQPDLTDDKKTAPYKAEELVHAKDLMTADLPDVGPANLPPVDTAVVHNHIIRRKDIVELFDTTPDLAGADIDVSRFIREADEHHVQVFWRDIDKSKGPDEAAPQPGRAELCSVPLADLKKRDTWRWDHLEKQWVKAESLYPGQVLMLRAVDGGYDERLGWTGKSKKRVAPVSTWTEIGDANDRDCLCENRDWQSIAAHTDRVVNAIELLLTAHPAIKVELKDAMRLAARWHDLGKAHPVFQDAMPEEKPPGIWAKSAGQMARYERPGFRHELASAVAMLQSGMPDLCAYLAAAHHGKVRLSIRSLPHEKAPEAVDVRFARGVWDNDRLPTVDLGGGIVSEPVTLSLSYMALGEDPVSGPSWLARMLDLRDALGPFSLTFLEALMRVADWRGSANEEDGR